MVVLVVSDDAGFSQAVARQWSESGEPAGCSLQFATNSAVQPQAVVAILDGPGKLSWLAAPVTLAVEVGGASAAPVAAQRRVSLPRGEGWERAAVAVAREAVLGLQAQRRAESAEHRLVQCGGGKIGISAVVRHELVNALTSVLGHCELLLLHREMPKDMRHTLEALRDSARRGGDILQGFLLGEREPRRAEAPLPADGRDSVMAEKSFEVHRA